MRRLLVALVLSAVMLGCVGTPVWADPSLPLPRMPICGDQDGSESPLVLNCPTFTPLADVQTFQVPGTGSVDLRFDFVFREATLNNELGFFTVDNAAGAIGKLNPGDPGYLTAALARATIIFPSGSDASTPDTTFSLPGGTIVVFFIVQDDSLANFVTNNPNNNVNSVPVAFFSLDTLNPDGIDHFVGFQTPDGHLTQFAFEDLTEGGDRDYDDVVYDIAPALHPIAAHLDLLPLTASLQVGQQHTLTATASDQSGAALPAVSVHFTVTGANPGSGDVLTDASGHAVFTYTGAHTGTDTIVATANVSGTSLTSNPATLTWAAANTPTNTPTATPTFTPIPTDTPTATPVPTNTPVPTDTPTIAAAPIVPSGTWINPKTNGFVVNGDWLHLAAHAYPTRPGDPPVAYVNFTAGWRVGKHVQWTPVCTVTQPRPRTSDVYECNWDLGQYRFPNGLLTVSFDVYDKNQHTNLAPNGVHRGTVQRPVMPVKKVVVFLAGIGTCLVQHVSENRSKNCDVTDNIEKSACSTPANDNTFGNIKAALASNDRFKCSKFLRYSYQGGKIIKSRWTPTPYSCGNTGQIIDNSVDTLASMLLQYRQANPRARFVLIGHSLGGVIALRLVSRLQNKENNLDIPVKAIDSVITIDSPLNHGSYQNLKDIADILGLAISHVPCGFGGPALLLYSNVANDLGDVIDNSYGQQIRRDNEALVAKFQEAGVKFMAIGNDQDCVWYLTLCNLTRGNLQGNWIDDSRSMVIENADYVKLYTTLRTGKCDLSNQKLLTTSLICVNDSHEVALHDESVTRDIADFVNVQGK